MKTAFLLLGSLRLCCDPLYGQSIPTTHAGSLADTIVNLPGDLKGRPAVLVLGFSKSSSEQTKPWADALKRDFESDREIAFYQHPMLQEAPRLLSRCKGCANREAQRSARALSQFSTMRRRGKW